MQKCTIKLQQTEYEAYGVTGSEDFQRPVLQVMHTAGLDVKVSLRIIILS